MKTKFKSTNFRGRFKVVDNHGVMWTKTKSKKDAEKIAKELNDTEYNRDVYAQKMFEKDFDKLKLYEAQQVNSKLKQDGYKLPIDYISNYRKSDKVLGFENESFSIQRELKGEKIK
jgi:hypothetical protein